MFKKCRYCPTGVPGYLIDTHFEYKEVSDGLMIEAITEYNKLFKIFCMKDPDCVIKIMTGWLILDELDGERTRRYFVDINGTKEMKQFTYHNPFGIHFRYRHQIDNHNNWRYAQIFLERTWATKFWLDHNFTWYLVLL